MNQKTSNEITIKIKCQLSEFYKIIEEKGLSQISCSDEIEKLVDKVLSDNPKSIEDFKAGKTQAVGYLMGQVMKASKGKANPPVAKQMIEEKLSKM